jgi:hypothetical protein
MAGIAGSPYFDNYLDSQKLSFLNPSFGHELFFMHPWAWTLAEIRYRLFMISHELQVFKICGGWELASHRWSSGAEIAIQILSLRARLMEFSSRNLF